MLSGNVRTGVYGPLIHVDRLVMPNWQRVVKRAFDVSFSFCLLHFSIYVWLACAVKMSSKGPVFYRQERVKVWTSVYIIKFRTMRVDAESTSIKFWR